MSELNFGKYAVVDPIVHRFEQEPEWFWVIRPVTSGDELAMQKFLWQRRVQESNGVREETPPVNMEIAQREIALSFVSTNIPKTKMVDGETVIVTDPEGNPVPILRENASPEAVEIVLRKMPPSMVNEIWKAVGQANPTWGPTSPKPIS